MDAEITVLVLNYNKFEMTCRFFENNMHYTHGVRWCLVDNGSDPGIVTRLVEYSKSKGWNIWKMNNNTPEKIFGGDENTSFDLLLLPKNSGYAKGNNSGIRFIELHQKPGLILVVNNDVFWSEDIIRPMADELKQRDDLAVLAPRIIDTNGKEQNPQFLIEYTKMLQTLYRLCLPISVLFYNLYSGIFNYHDHNKSLFQDANGIVFLDTRKNCFMGSCFLIKYPVFKEIGFFDPETFLGAEEPILVHKLREKNYQTGILSTVQVLHDQGATCRSVFSARQIYELFEESDAYYLETYCNYSKNRLKLVKLGRDYYRIFWLPLVTWFHNYTNRCT